MKKKIRNVLVYIILYTKNFRLENGIIIFSEARGGSTWLMEILNHIPGSCINWEPLHVEKGVVPKDFKWGWRPYIPKENRDKRYFKLIRNILSFKVYSNWSSTYFRLMSISSMIKSKVLITKFVRANLLLPYIVSRFKFNNKPILLIRHPVDVCISQLIAFGDNDKNNSLEITNCIKNNRFILHKDFVETLQTKLEYKIANWCLNNCSLLKDRETLNKVTIIFYSDLLINPKEEILRVLKTLKNFTELDSEKIIESIDFKKRSKTDFKKNLKSDPKKQLYKNFEKLSKLEMDSIQNIFNHFQLELFDAYQPWPHKTRYNNNHK